VRGATFEVSTCSGTGRTGIARSWRTFSARRRSRGGRTFSGLDADLTCLAPTGETTVISPNATLFSAAQRPTSRRSCILSPSPGGAVQLGANVRPRSRAARAACSVAASSIARRSGGRFSLLRSVSGCMCWEMRRGRTWGGGGPGSVMLRPAWKSSRWRRRRAAQSVVAMAIWWERWWCSYGL
jgi:hypothetical protein